MWHTPSTPSPRHSPVPRLSLYCLRSISPYGATSLPASISLYSVKNGLDALSEEVEYVAVHDGVRALATKKMILRVQLAAEETEAAIPVTEVVDSYRRVDGSESYIVPRSALRIVQTPQTFSAELLRRAYEQPFSDKFTDDASVVEALGAKITLVEGERRNIKLTTPEDMLIAERLLEE